MDDYEIRGRRFIIDFSLPNGADCWVVKCLNSAELSEACPGSLRISRNTQESTSKAIDRAIERLGLQAVAINLKQGSVDKIILTGFAEDYNRELNNGRPIPDLDDDMTEFLSRFPFVVFLALQTVLVSKVITNQPGQPEFPGVNFAKVVNRSPFQAQNPADLTRLVDLSHRKFTIVYISSKMLGEPLRPISICDRIDLNDDEAFKPVSKFADFYDACAAQHRARGELLPQLIFGFDEDASTDSEGDKPIDFSSLRDDPAFDNNVL